VALATSKYRNDPLHQAVCTPPSAGKVPLASTGGLGAGPLVSTAKSSERLDENDSVEV
jgi:hypothetical protein